MGAIKEEEEMIVQKQDCIMDVDVEKTIEYYRDHSLCDCPACQNFYAQAATALPKLNEFLSELGVDISRPDETGWDDISDGVVDYFFVAYTVGGKILEYDKYEIDIWDGDLFLNIVIGNNGVPNKKTGEYFTIWVYGIKLPWILEERLPEVKLDKTMEKKSGFFNRIKKYFLKKQ